MDLKVFLITVAPNPDWEKRVRDRLPGCELEVVDQFDLRGVGREEALRNIDSPKFRRNFGRLPSNGAIGCALAHRYCYQRLLRSGAHSALILEDDVLPDALDPALISALLESDINFDVINLASINAVVSRHPDLQVREYALHRSLYFSHGAGAYLLSRSGARRLIAAQSEKISAWADYPIHAWLIRLFLVLPPISTFSGRPTGVQYPPPPERRVWTDYVVFRVRQLIWNAIGWFRISVMKDLRIP